MSKKDTKIAFFVKMNINNLMYYCTVKKLFVFLQKLYNNIWNFQLNKLQS